MSLDEKQQLAEADEAKRKISNGLLRSKALVLRYRKHLLLLKALDRQKSRATFQPG